MSDELITRLKVTNHAIERYRQRIHAFDESVVRLEMINCLRAGNAKKLAKGARKRRGTTIIPTGCCLLVVDSRSIVTVLHREHTWNQGN